MAKDIRVLLYYKYVPIENAEQFTKDHLAFCKSIGLKGRILVADEGTTGTVLVTLKQLRSIWTMFTHYQEWKIFGLKLT